MEGLLVLWTLFAGGYALNEVMTENQALVDQAALVEQATDQPVMEVSAFDAELDGDAVAKK